MENSGDCFLSSSTESVDAGSVIVDSDSDFCGDRLIKLRAEDIRYKAVKNVFLSGMEKNSKDLEVTSVYAFSRDTFSGQSRWGVFNMNSKAIAKKNGGHSNVKRAWYGSSKQVIAGVARAVCSEADENGIQHMILCSIILGNPEQVSPGSKQFYPSSDEFDCGVDNLEKPGLYVVWGTHMNTHIFPEFVVSFKAPAPLQEFWDGYNWKKGAIGTARRLSSTIHHKPQKRSPFKTSQAPFGSAFNKMKLLPTGPTSWMPFAKLIDFLANILPLASTGSIHKHYQEYRDGKITRDNFVRQLRQLAGDKLIVAAIKYARSKSHNAGLMDLPEYEMIISLFGAYMPDWFVLSGSGSGEMSFKQIRLIPALCSYGRAGMKVNAESSPTDRSVCTGNSVNKLKSPAIS